jgi:hypothetical protein
MLDLEPLSQLDFRFSEHALVYLHLGQAAEFQIWGPGLGGFDLIEVREAPIAGQGELRWKQLAELLPDCRHVLVSGIGETPRAVLQGFGVEPLELNCFIEEALKAIYAGDDRAAMRVRKARVCCAEKMGMGEAWAACSPGGNLNKCLGQAHQITPFRGGN